MSTYSEYFEVDRGYYPEINPSSIHNAENKWENTYPHKTFVSLLKSVERMLARTNNESKKGIWIEGSYGTGKSQIMWALKNLLDCSSEKFSAYFSSYSVLESETDLRDKLLSAKEGKIITVSSYGTGGIDTTGKLIRHVFDAVTRALKRSGMDYKGADTIRGRIVDWLSEEENKHWFNSKIQHSEYRGLGSFAGKDAETILGLLKNSQAKVDGLIDDIMQLSEQEGLRACTFNMEELNAWLCEVIEINHLKALVFLWDEFSSYFKANRNSLDEFQKLAEVSNEKPFYLIIATHTSGMMFSENDEAFRIVRDRFISQEITMPDNIAFELIAHVMKIKEAGEAVWADLADDLNSRMHDSCTAVSQFVHVDEGYIKKLLPMHPMTALLLKNIATAFASNQRSMFNFIKNENEDLKAFQWYIETHSPENVDILTIDYLWDFFYVHGRDENVSGAGRDNLDSVVAMILDTYQANASKLNQEDQTVLKTILMMQAISQKMGNI